MIVISPPYIKTIEKEVLVSSDIIVNGVVETLWYKIPKKFKDYIVTENLDAFLVGILFLGLKTGQDIKLKGPVSARLYYTLNHYLIPALCLANPKWKKIKLFEEGLNDLDLNTAKVAATGLSCGVDSLASYYDHICDEGAYKIKYFTYFNVGSHGDLGGKFSRNIYLKRLKKIKEFGAKVKKEVIEIDSNLSEILLLNFQETHTLRSISCVLLLQKLFKTFYYASSVKFDNYKLDKIRIAEYDLLTLQMLSTESVQFFSSATQFSRTEKIEIIAKQPDTYSYLDVCVNPELDIDRINCSECHKCVRTMITLDALGSLENFSKVFDIVKFSAQKNKYLGQLLFKRNKETLDQELIKLLKKGDFFPIISYYYGIQYYIRLQKILLKKKVKMKLKLI